MKILVMTLALLMTGAAMAENTSKTGTGNATTPATSKTTEGPTQLDDLIRGEMAAVRSYNQALEKVKDSKVAEKLKAIKNDHESAVTTLKKYAGKDVKEDTKDSGIWGGFTKAFTGAGALLGNTAALKALNTGENHGINEYEEALEDENIKPELKEEIRTKLLPQQKKHIETLKSFM